VPEAPRIPFVRIARPYGSDNEFVEGDFAWLGRTTIILPNGPARTVGELVRFEIVLTNGAPVLRGEGHVVAHHIPGGPRPAGLEVRYTRVDAKSKLILDRVRERRTQNGETGKIRVSQVPSVGEVRPLNGQPGTSPVSSVLPVLKPPADTPSERSGVHLTKSAEGRVAPPANRDEILERLRVRARELVASGRLAFKKS
jgi:hypothetical protein